MGVEPVNEASRFLTDGVPTIGSRAVEAMWDAVSADFRRDDRRRLVGLPDDGAKGFVDGIEALFDVGSGTPSFSVVRIVATRGQRLALAHNKIEYPDGNAIELLSLIQLTTDLDRMEREVDFDVDDVEAAVAELDQLDTRIGDEVPSMSDPTENAALRSILSILADQNTADPDDAAPQGRGDFFIDDRTRGAANAGIVTAAEAVEWFRAAFDVADGARPRWDVLEVLGLRGDRLAAVLVRMTYGNDLGVKETVVIEQLDETLVPERAVYYSPEDTDLALAELDRLHARIEAGDNTPPAT